MTFNNKNVCFIFASHVPLCVQKLPHLFSKYPLFITNMYSWRARLVTKKIHSAFHEPNARFFTVNKFSFCYERYKDIFLIIALHPEWPHRQCVGLAYTWKRVRAPVVAASLAICRPRLHRAIRGAQRLCPWGWGVRPVNWIYHCPSLVVVDCNQEFPIWCYFSILLQVVDNRPHILW